MTQDVHTLVVAGSVGGDVEALGRLLAEGRQERMALVLVGDLGRSGQPETLRAVFKAVGAAGCPAFWIPGAGDAPIQDYLRESFNMETVFEQLRGVHGTMALAPGPVLFGGMGGEIVDDRDTVRDEDTRLHYPAWEAEYRLKVLRELEFKDYPLVLLLGTPPAHKGTGQPGSEALAELVKTHRARVALVAGDEPLEERLGTTLVVCPGRLADGHYAVVDVLGDSCESRSLAGVTAI